MQKNRMSGEILQRPTVILLFLSVCNCVVASRLWLSPPSHCFMFHLGLVWGEHDRPAD